MSNDIDNILLRIITQHFLSIFNRVMLLVTDKKWFGLNILKELMDLIEIIYQMILSFDTDSVLLRIITWHVLSIFTELLPLLNKNGFCFSIMRMN